MRKKALQRGFAPIWIILILAAVGSAVYVGKKGIDTYYNQNEKDALAINELLKQSSAYIDSAKLKGARVDDPVIGIVLLPDGTYSAYKIVKAQVGLSKTGQIGYTNNAEIGFLTGDIGSGMYADGKVNPLYLLNGKTVEGNIVSRMTALLTTSNGQSFPIKIYEGTVVNGKLVGDFKAQTYSSGHIILGKFNDQGNLTAVSVSLGAEKIADSLTAVVPQALNLFRKQDSANASPVSSFFSLEQGTNLNSQLDVLKGTLSEKEPFVNAGNSNQYWRGDKTWQTLSKDTIGLDNVENTALSEWSGTSNITKVGSVSSGTWKGTKIADAYISSADTWNSFMDNFEIPSQSGQNGKVLGTNGSSLAWVTNASGSAWGSITGTLSEQTDVSDAINSKEPAITVGAASQYFRGDKTWQNFDKAAIGLGNVENTAVSTWAGSTNLTTLGTVTSGTLSTGLTINFNNTTETGTASIDISGNAATATSATSATTATNFSGSLVGDVTGTQGVTVVGKINGATLGTTTATSGNVLIANGSSWITQALSGDATINSSGVVTLKDVGSAATYGSATQVPVFTTDAQGRVSGVTNTTISGLTSTNLSGTANITNAQLQNSSITVSATAGTGLTISGSPVALGGTVTLAGINATTAVKGVASFNSTNFSVAGGAVNTIQNIDTTADPLFRSLSLSKTTNQIILGTTNTTTISAAAPAANRTVTIPALVTNSSDTFSFLNEAQTLTNKTIAAGSNTISGLTNSNLSGSAGITDANLATISTANKVSGSAVQLATGAGLEDSTGLTLLTSCSNTQILKWNGSAWACATDNTGGTPSVYADGGLLSDVTGLSLIRTCADNQVLKWTAGGGWACASDNAGGGALTVLETDGAPSVAAVTQLEFGPASTSSDEFIVTDQTGGVARIRTGNKVVLTDASQALTNKTIAAGSNTISGLTNTNLSGTAGITDANLATITTSNKVSGSAVQLSATGGLTNNSGLSLLTTCSDTQVLVWNNGTSTWECGAASVSLSSILAAAASNTINNADYAQVWNWSLTTAAKTGFTFGENVASTNGAGAQYILGISTLPTSTAAPLKVVAQNNTIIDTTADGGLTLGSAAAGQAVNIYSGTGALNVGSDANAKTITVGTTTSSSALNMYAGTGNFILDGAGATTYSIGSSTTSGTFGIGGTAQTGTASLFTGTGGLSINMGTGAASNAITIGNTTTSTSLAFNSGTGNITNQTPNSSGTIFKTSTANDDSIRIAPGLNGGGGTFQGTITTLDLSAARTWTFQNSSGIIPLSTSPNTLFFTTTGNTALTLPTSGTVTALGNSTTGSGSTIVLATSPTLTTPDIGVATATSINGLTLTANATGFSIAGGTTSKTLTLNNTITLAADADGETFTFPASGGDVTVLGNTTTGSGAIVLANSPTLITPTLGIATATTINRVTLTQPATGSTLTIAEGKTLTANNSLTLAGIDGKTLTVNNSLTLTGADSKTWNFGSNNLTFTTTADTSVTFPTTGTLATTSQLHTQNTDTSTTSSTFVVGNSLTQDQLSLTTVAKGTTTFVGNITSADLTATRTWTLPDASGTVLLSESDTLDTVTGRGATTSNALTLNGGITTTTTTALTLDSGTTGNVSLGTGANAKTVAIGNSTGATAVNITSGTGNVNFTVGPTSSSGKVQIGNSATATPDLLVLDNGTSDPSGVAGGMYYNTGTGKFRCYENGAWANCITSSGSSSGLKMVYKTANQTNATITLANDTDLKFDIGASEVWSFRFIFQMNSPAPADSKWNISTPASPTSCKYAVSVYRNNTSTTSNVTCGTPATGIATSGNDEIIEVSGTIENGTNAGTVNVQWAENSASGTFTVYRDSFLIAAKSTGADLAEMYTTNDGSIEIGDVVSLDSTLQAGVKKSGGVYDSNVFGIVSTKPGLVIGDFADEGVKTVPVALSGRVPVKVSIENGVISAGDYLTTSSIPGVAMKATKAGAVIGTAMFPYSGEEVGQIMAFVKNGSTTGNLASSKLTSTELLASLVSNQTNFAAVNLSEVVTDRVIAGLEVVTPKVVAKEIIADNLTVGTITADKIKANQIEGLTILADALAVNKIGSMIDSAFSKQATSSQAVAVEATESANTLGNIDFSKDLTTVLGALKVNKGVEIGLDLKVLGALTAKGGLVVQGPARFKDTAVFEALTQFISNVIFKGNVSFEGQPTFNSDTADVAVIKKDLDKVRVTFDKEYKFTPKVVITLEANSNDLAQAIFDDTYQYAVTDKSPKGFTITLDKKAKRTLSFSWIAIATNKEVVPVIDEAPAPSPIPEPAIIPESSPSAGISPVVEPTPIPESTESQTVN